MKAADVMTRRIISVTPEASIREAAKLMLKHRISGLPVVDSAGSLVGIITEGDFMRRMETGTERKRPRWLEFLAGPAESASEYVHSHGRRVGDIMTPNPLVIGKETPLSDVVELMERHHVKRLPVVEGRRPIGMVSRANLLHWVASHARRPSGSEQDDRAIRERILDELDRQSWAWDAAVNVVVHDRIVELWGEVGDEAYRKAVKVLAENVPGVKAVLDHLSLAETGPS
jgi:CBS domain-containing protein